jgi:hypothetical protein
LTSLRTWRTTVAELPGVKNRSGQTFEADDLRRLGRRDPDKEPERG